ncbi:histidine phosphatase family protein [Pseudalkalibacillus hwajinpoensis]|uniref:histidine phosphatase family protein n=1 Tax=Guptibacillus hwajinpoensis TaxID=208199 RepID=UPI00325C1482
MLKKLYLTRHCAAEGQEADASLSPEGRNQAVELAQKLASIPFDKLFSSPFLRAIQSIEPLALQLDKPITLDDRLEERRLSGEQLENWHEELEKTFNDFTYKLQGGESSEKAANRGIETVLEALDITKEFALVMTHGNLFTLILNHFDNTYGFQAWKGLTNPDVYCLCFEDDQLVSMEHLFFEGNI